MDKLGQAWPSLLAAAYTEGTEGTGGGACWYGKTEAGQVPDGVAPLVTVSGLPVAGWSTFFFFFGHLQRVTRGKWRRGSQQTDVRGGSWQLAAGRTRCKQKRLGEVISISHPTCIFSTALSHCHPLAANKPIPPSSSSSSSSIHHDTTKCPDVACHTMESLLTQRPPQMWSIGTRAAPLHLAGHGSVAPACSSPLQHGNGTSPQTASALVRNWGSSLPAWSRCGSRQNVACLRPPPAH